MKTALNTRRAFGVLVVITIGYFLYILGPLQNISVPFFSLMPVTENALAVDLTELVNVFIGTTNGGHVFPGATLPHGMIKAGMDTDSPGNHAGYDADPRYNVIGFSQLHDEGTGGNIPLSNFKLFPILNCKNFTACTPSLHSRKIPRKFKYAMADFAPGGTAPPGGGVTEDYGKPGYFATNLSNGIQVELTATRRTALHRYTFPSKEAAEEYGIYDSDADWRPRLVVDITNDGMGSGSDAKVNVDPSTGRVTGSGRYIASFGYGTYYAFVCVDFRSEQSPNTQLLPEEYGVYVRDTVFPNESDFTGAETWGERGAILTFSSSTARQYAPRAPLLSARNETTTILARVGVSLISVSQACDNAEHEIPDFNFDEVRESARKEWNELLGRVEIPLDDIERNRDTAVLFYSSLYRSHIVPADYSGENPKWQSSAPYYDSLYCNWDTYRTLFPLMSLHDPETYARIVQSFVDIQQHEGWLPECRSATIQQFIQGGSSGDPILAEFYIKYKAHLEDLNVNASELYAALIKDAEVEPQNWDMMGRQTSLWKEYGYIPSGVYKKGGMATRQVSRTLEYAFDDFTISRVAKELGYMDDFRKYANRSRGFELVWNPETTILEGEEKEVEGIKGFMQPRYENGSFFYTDPRHCTVHDPKHSTCFLDGFNKDGFYEGGPIVYSQYVPHDTAKLIELQGGNEAFIRRLDYIFDNDYFDSTNEPSQQIPFMYHYANRPGLSTERSRQTIAQSYNTSVNGLPGNDDSGAMGSYVFFYMLGLYPLPATRQILVSSPYFKQVRIRNPFLHTITTINALGFEDNPDNGTGGRIYVKSITVNGERWHSNCFIEWSHFEIGATIDLELTDDRTVACGPDASAIPPSLSTGGYGEL